MYLVRHAIICGHLAIFGLYLSAGMAYADAPIAIAIHGGAGTLDPNRMGAADAEAIQVTLTSAVRAGHAVLSEGGSSLDAVIMAVTLLESSPRFNAGVGAVMTWEGHHELDASLMRGDTLQAGAVAGVRTVKSPIRLAQAVMEHSPHVLLVGPGAEAFARQQGLQTVANDYFTTPRRRASWERFKAEYKEARHQSAQTRSEKWGTVGAVALDRHGNLAAATSTGGMTGKRWGRVGDSPLIGAGTWADNRSCAVSATGHGEYFIRNNVAADICARVRYTGVSLADAANQVVNTDLAAQGGTGGVIAVDSRGNLAMPFNTPGMYRAYIDAQNKLGVAFHEKELEHPQE